MKLIMENWKRFLKEGAAGARPARLSDVDGEYFLSQMSPEARADILNAVNQVTVHAVQGHSDVRISNTPGKNTEGLKTVIDQLDPAVTAELKKISDEHSLNAHSVILVLLANENELATMLRKFDTGRPAPFAHEL